MIIRTLRALKAESLARTEGRRHSVQCTASKVARAPVKLCSRGASPRPKPRAGRRAAFLYRPRTGTSARAFELTARCFEPRDFRGAGLLTDGDIVTSSGVASGCKTVSNAWFGSAFGISTGTLVVDFWPSGEMRPAGPKLPDSKAKAIAMIRTGAVRIPKSIKRREDGKARRG